MVQGIIDSHCHFDAPAFAPDRAQVWNRAVAAGVDALILPGYDPQHWQRLAQLAATNTAWFAAFGAHPCYLADLYRSPGQSWEQRLRRYLRTAVALGEIGLDRGPDASPWAIQLDFLHRQLDLAEELGLPVILHARRSTEDLLQNLRHRSGLRGVLHSFSGSWVQAQKALDIGLYIGLGGALTHPRARRLRALAARLPEGSFLVETDAPWQAPADGLGQRNEPARIVSVLATLAALRDTDMDSLSAITAAATRSLFSLPDV
ncbi:TatD family hydrolase [Acidithiobacillus caldus]|jgi:TatD DNase family protein|nr:TatD family hydrolase [Acidithiobacillus caldus]MBU2729557.1 TatD family hydrolase [Acidithiobacillus caldus]MBU2734904.1 TatD family hydrolase [Acidithiobacillus caldus ATCC 51756]MBU2744186.1 TatD family hydrolase [Acidithiobacillus caldus]MBU2779690.1 TatD family hydrolase [Acidithiobacillus caldus]MBU2781947.1 TatD family hydrolase [Acidithiobacillus caldus]